MGVKNKISVWFIVYDFLQNTYTIFPEINIYKRTEWTARKNLLLNRAPLQVFSVFKKIQKHLAHCTILTFYDLYFASNTRSVYIVDSATVNLFIRWNSWEKSIFLLKRGRILSFCVLKVFILLYYPPENPYSATHLKNN